MANNYFRFKEFIIQQDSCAMKVCTDSCLFGAWCARWFQGDKAGAYSVLDIGAGTGLLSLMLAQKLPGAMIDAVEIEASCFHQAERNILQSDWKNRITIHNGDINHFSAQTKYDVIISNPPFFESDLSSHNAARNTALHDAGLTLRQLLTAIRKLLSDDGCCFILLPSRRTTEFENMITEYHFFINKRAFVKQTEMHSIFRVMYLVSKENKAATEEEIIIKKQSGYSSEFVSLLKDYYLHL